jgi:hypothetical protein
VLATAAASMCGREYARPIVRKHDGREQKAEDYIDDYACGKAEEGLRSHASEFTEASSKPDREKAEDKGPTAQVLDGSDEVRLDHLLVLVVGVAGAQQRDERRGDEEAQHKFREAPPDLGEARPASVAWLSSISLSFQKSLGIFKFGRQPVPAPREINKGLPRLRPRSFLCEPRTSQRTLPKFFGIIGHRLTFCLCRREREVNL